jgi:hypothetical protein
MPYPNAPFAPQQPQLPPWAAGATPQLPPQMGGPPPVAGGMGPGGPTGIPGDLAGGMPPGGMPQAPGGPPGADAGQLDPAIANQVLGVGSNKIEQQKLKQQYALADALRADAKGQMEMRGGGRVQTAPGWANAAASIAGQYAANKQQERADTGIDKFQAGKAKASGSILKRMGLLSGDDDTDDQSQGGY